MALRDDLKKRPFATQLRQLLDPNTGEAVVDLVVTHHLAAGVGAGWTNAQLLAAGDALFQLEYDHARDAYQKIAAIAVDLHAGNHAGQLGAAANQLAEATYGVVAGDTDQTKAARWVCHASNSLGPANVPAIQATLQEIERVATSLTTVDGWTAINTSVNMGAVPGARRGIDTGGGQLPSPESGRTLLGKAAQHVTGFAPANANQWQDLACYLLGAVIRSHGCTDGNGRTARALYATCFIRGAVPFVAPTIAFENTLSGL